MMALRKRDTLPAKRIEDEETAKGLREKPIAGHIPQTAQIRKVEETIVDATVEKLDVQRLVRAIFDLEEHRP